jgi:hypothetical protein
LVVDILKKMSRIQIYSKYINYPVAFEIEGPSLICLSLPLGSSGLEEDCPLGGRSHSLKEPPQFPWVDIGGHPPIPLGPPPLLLSVFQFPHSLLFLAVFWVLNFQSRFEALNFFGKTSTCFFDVSHIKSCIPQIDISNEVLSMSNRDRMPKLRPREVDVPIYPNGAHSLGVSSPRVRSLDV